VERHPTRVVDRPSRPRRRQPHRTVRPNTDRTDIAPGGQRTARSAPKPRKGPTRTGRDRRGLPFPILGIDSTTARSSSTHILLTYCRDHEITFTRSRPGHKNDGAPREQKNCSSCARPWATTATPTGPDRHPQRIYALSAHRSTSSPHNRNWVHNPPRREGHQTTRHAQTPFQRLLADPTLDITTRPNLHHQFLTSTPAHDPPRDPPL